MDMDIYIYIYPYPFFLFILNFGFEGAEKTRKGLAVREGEKWGPQYYLIGIM
jgi:hypothetical protein